MYAKTIRVVAALVVLGLQVSTPQTAVLGQSQDTSRCVFSDPTLPGGVPLSQVVISGMHAIGKNALPGLDGQGSIYPMFRGELVAMGEEATPSGLLTTYVRIEGVGNCEDWVMDIFHLEFAENLKALIGFPIDVETLLGIHSMNGVAPQFLPHWHLAVGTRGARPEYVKYSWEPIIVKDAVGSVLWYDPRDLLASNPPGGNLAVTVAEETPQAQPVLGRWSKQVWQALYGFGALLAIFSSLVISRSARRVAVRTSRWAVLELLYRLFWGARPARWQAWKTGCWYAVFMTGLYMIGFASLQILIIRGLPLEMLQSSRPGAISMIFTPEVQAWSPEITEWSQTYDLDPNLVATIMQIESCGNASAVSVSGAQGLFQVMPFHFVAGEDMQDPDTNAHRGLTYLKRTLAAYPDDIGRAIAAYNGGINGVSKDYQFWPAETKRYYYWGGIYNDALSGESSSLVLDEWLAAGGQNLCQSARR